MNFVKNFSIFAAMSLGAIAQQNPGLSAHWDGRISIPDRDKQIHLTVDLAKNDAGEWVGSVSIPDAKIQNVPIVGLSVTGTAVKFGLGVANTSFEGKLSAAGDLLAGNATSDEGSAPFELKRAGVADVKMPAVSSALSKDFEGSWEGSLDLAGQKMRALLKLERAANGRAKGVLVSVDQGNQEFPITTITQKDKQLQFELTMIRAKYSGVLSESTGEITGEYSVDNQSLPLVFKRAAK